MFVPHENGIAIGGIPVYHRQFPELNASNRTQVHGGKVWQRRGAFGKVQGKPQEGGSAVDAVDAGGSCSMESMAPHGAVGWKLWLSWLFFMGQSY